MDCVRHVCASLSCATAEKYDADRLCAGCRSVFYCCSECQRDDWKGHKPACRVATAEREASQIVRVGRGGGRAPPAAAPERVGHPASQWVAGAARGEAKTLCHLDCCYDTGEGVPQSYERAAKLWKQAAAKGHAGAQYNLGCSYRDGQGVPQSYERAVELFQQAAEQGEASAQSCLGNLYRDGSGVTQSYERAAELFQQAAAKGDANAHTSLGVLYREGKGVPQSYERAAKLFQQAADQGVAQAQAGLGALYYNGLGVSKDAARAVALVKQAAAGDFKLAADDEARHRREGAGSRLNSLPLHVASRGRPCRVRAVARALCSGAAAPHCSVRDLHGARDSLEKNTRAGDF